MDISNKPSSILDYIGNQQKSVDTLNALAQRQRQNVSSGIGALDAGLGGARFDETLQALERGDINVDLGTVDNYFQFNRSRLSRELTELAGQFQSSLPVRISVEDQQLRVEDDSPEGQRLQQYLDRDTRLNELFRQTSRLSQFVEWGEARQQASRYQSDEVAQDSIVNFLQDARRVISENNSLSLSRTDITLASEGYSGRLIDDFEEAQGITRPENNQQTAAANLS